MGGIPPPVRVIPFPGCAHHGRGPQERAAGYDHQLCDGRTGGSSYPTDACAKAGANTDHRNAPNGTLDSHPPCRRDSGCCKLGTTDESSRQGLEFGGLQQFRHYEEVFALRSPYNGPPLRASRVCPPAEGLLNREAETFLRCFRGWTPSKEARGRPSAAHACATPTTGASSATPAITAALFPPEWSRPTGQPLFFGRRSRFRPCEDVRQAGRSPV